MSCNAVELAEIELFARLKPDDLQILANVIDYIHVTENEILFN